MSDPVSTHLNGDTLAIALVSVLSMAVYLLVYAVLGSPGIVHYVTSSMSTRQYRKRRLIRAIKNLRKSDEKTG